MSDLEISVLNNQEEPLRGINVRFEYISRHFDGVGWLDVNEGWGGEARTDEEGHVCFNDVKENGFLIKVYLNNKFAGRAFQKRITFNMGRREKYDDGRSGYYMCSG